jgi:hypothetical protein
MKFDKFVDLHKVPMIDKKVTRKMNPRTNRIKNFKTTRYLKTDVDHNDRTFKNLPRYANGKVKVRFQDWLLIKGEKRKEDHCTQSVGKSEADGKWYGWSHRAVAGFEPGEKVTKDTCGSNGREFTIKDDKQAKQMAIDFANDVS